LEAQGTPYIPRPQERTGAARTSVPEGTRGAFHRARFT
jgi:hypothetical protein